MDLAVRQTQISNPPSAKCEAITSRQRVAKLNFSTDFHEYRTLLSLSN